MPKVNAELRNNPAVFLAPEVKAKCEVIDDLGADTAKYTKIWDQIKGGELALKPREGRSRIGLPGTNPLESDIPFLREAAVTARRNRQSAPLAFGRPDSVPKLSIFLTTSIPSTTDPKTTCLPSSQAV